MPTNAVYRLRPGDDKNARLSAAVSDSAFIIHTLPDFHPDAEIVGLCHVPPGDSHPSEYGWMVSDFLAFKSLLDGVGRPEAQSWMSYADIGQATGKPACSYEHTGKDVTAAKDTRLSVFSQTADLLEHFVNQVRAHAAKARKNRTGLVIFAFGPVTPEQDLCFSLEEDLIVTTHNLRTAALGGENRSFPAVLLTSSAFTSGWAVSPALCGVSPSAEEQKLNLVAKSCGSVFAADLIKKFTERSTPLLTESERAKTPYDDLMPVHPTDEQRKLRNLFHVSIYKTLVRRAAQRVLGHSLHFSPPHDAWKTYAPRRGRSLRFWQDKWGVKTPEPAEVPEGDVPFLGNAFGGSVESQIFHVRFLARLELHTSRRDRFNMKTQVTNRMLALAIYPNFGVQQVFKDVFEIIEFRASRISLVNLVANYLDLPLPDDTKCRFWHETVGDGTQRDAWAHLMGIFSPSALPPETNRTVDNDIIFWKPVAWLAAAIGRKLEHGSKQEIEEFVLQRVVSVFRDTHNAQSAILLDHSEVRERGINWLKSIGMVGNGILRVPSAYSLHAIEQDLPSVEAPTTRSRHAGQVQKPPAKPVTKSARPLNAAANSFEAENQTFAKGTEPTGNSEKVPW